MIELLSNKIFLDSNYEIREYYTDGGNVRAFCSDGCIQSLIYIDKEKRKKLLVDYFYFYNLPIYLNPNGKKFLMLGGGCFSYSYYFIANFYDKKMDVVEINHEYVDYAKQYFYLDELIEEYDLNGDRLNIVICDAIEYILCCQKKYDYIFIDLFNGREPIKEIYMQTNLMKLKQILNKDGILIVNYIISSEDMIYKDIFNSLIQITNNYKIITNKNYFDLTNNVGNIIVVLSNNEINIPNDYDYLDVTGIIF